MFSEETLRSNLEALARAGQPHDFVSGLDETTIRPAASPTGVRLEIATRDGRWVPVEGEDPAGRAVALAQQLDPAADQIVVIGAGLGHLIDALERRHKRPTVVLFEPVAGVATLMLARRDFGSWLASGALRVLVGPDYLGATAAAKALDGAKPVLQIASPVLAGIRPEWVERASAVGREIVAEAAANAEARRRFAGRYLTNTLRNSPRIASGADVAALTGLMAKRPAIVVGAGPSLDQNLHDIEEVRDRAVIIAADTALRPLLAAGVEPHLVVAVDPAELNARHIAGVNAPNLHLVAEGSVHPTAFDAFGGRTFFFKVSDHDPWPWLRAAGCDRGLLQAWGSVVTSAFDLARRLGCDPICFAGLDLAFTHDRPYCRHTIFDRMWLDAIEAHGYTWQQVFDDYFTRVPVEWTADLAGTRVRTTPHLMAFKNWLVEAMASDTSRRYVNGTGAGLLFGGAVEQVPLRAVLSRAVSQGEIVNAFASAYHASSRSSASLGLATATLLDAFDQPASHDLIERWLTFAAGTLTTSDVRAALSDADAQRVASDARVADDRPTVSA